MSETKFAPGPWLPLFRYGQWSIQQTNSLTPISQIVSIGGAEMTDANAHLIADANDFHNDAGASDFHNDADARVAGTPDNLDNSLRNAWMVLAKARGEQ